MPLGCGILVHSQEKGDCIARIGGAWSEETDYRLELKLSEKKGRLLECSGETSNSHDTNSSNEGLSLLGTYLQLTHYVNH